MLVLIIANGELHQNSRSSELIDDADYIIAADGGANHCSRLSLVPDFIVGDMDSIASRTLEHFEKLHVTLEKHPVKKDSTDLELALNQAATLSASKIHILGALGGRWDMSLANILLSANEVYKEIAITLSGDDGQIQILHPGTTSIQGQAGQRISFIPLRGDATGVTLTGFEYPLEESIIPFGSTLGVSNILEEAEATVEFKSSVLLCITS